MPMFRKKPVTIEAQYVSDPEESKEAKKAFKEVAKWCDGEAINDAVRGTCILIRTMEGHHIADVGDYIVKGLEGEFYPLKIDAFIKAYEPVMPEGFTGGEG